MNGNRPDRGVPAAFRRVLRVQDPGMREQEDLIVREKALTIYLNSKEFATIVCSPVHLDYMAVGFLCAEGILQKRSDLKEITIDEEKGLAFVVTGGEPGNLAERLFLKRYITPCCGRSRASFYFSTDALLCRKIVTDLKVTAADVRSLAEELEERSQLFRKTGGVHSAALAVDGKILLYHEDVGRHNTLDKILGQCFLEGIPLEDKLIVFSGRVSSEVLLKTAKMGIAVIISRSAPTDLALDLAEDLGITVVGFARGKRFNVYTHPERVVTGR
ncbi:MAG TPA: formate dehydrogenase accessory sulfurtransferase FdhD [Syntrophomonadaceae bacterium]|nr:formate dehydrogenase accessory sulfurtransferase FdhD [Syntrophomonadaceae bacterium]